MEAAARPPAIEASDPVAPRRDDVRRGRGGGLAGSLLRARHALRRRLEARRGEIEQALLARVYGIADPTQIGDLAYLDGFRAAASAALDYALSTLDSSEDSPVLIPPLLNSQARLAARHGVPLDMVLRRYTAGHSLLVDFVLEEAERGASLPPVELRRLLAAGSSRLDRLLACVSEEYAREVESLRTFTQQHRRTECVERLLAGELIDLTELNYEFDGSHVALIAVGDDASGAVQELASRLGRISLRVRPEKEIVWAWLGGRRRIDFTLLQQAVEVGWPDDIRLAMGEPAEGLSGWRFSHRQALAALPLALRGSERAVWYGDVALLASVLQDDLLISSLRQRYLGPLGDDGRGRVLRETLRTYLASSRNTTAAAAVLRTSRQTVRSRLQAIEERIGRPIDSAVAEIEVALRLEVLKA